MQNELMKLIKSGIFPNEKNRVWTMCQVVLKLATLCVEEAEKYKLVDEQFYISFEDCLNKLSCRDHSNPSKGRDEFNKDLEDFYKDQN